MPSASPSPIKRPSLVERTSSNHSLSSSGKQSTAHRPHRPHVVNRHSRNVSYGKNLSKLNKVNSAANVAERPPHERKKSAPGAITATSPKGPATMKRNSSHVTLPKNLSHGNLRRNHSATALARNTSHPALKKLGLAPAPQPTDRNKKEGFFELGNNSSGDEDEAEWEDSNTHSPEVTRNNSKTSTPARIATPNGERVPVKPPDLHAVRPQRTSSPPTPSIKNNNRSLPNLRRDTAISLSDAPQDPPLLHNNGRSSRAPPAISTISAHAGPNGLLRSESSKSFTHISHDEAAPTHTAMASSTGVSTSNDGGVSHFLSSTPAEAMASSSKDVLDHGSDDDSPSNFMSNYRPQPSESPEKARVLNKTRIANIPSRTQQKLELQRRETMRAAGGAPATPPAPGMGLSAGSSISLHSRSGSRGRARSLAEEIKALKQDYETGVKQLLVMRRFRNPILESISRLKDSGVLSGDIGTHTPSGAASKSRPPSRRGLPNAVMTSQPGGTNPHSNINGVASKPSVQSSTASASALAVAAAANAAAENQAQNSNRAHETNEHRQSAVSSNSRANSRATKMELRASTGGGGGRVHFHQPGSHDDMGVTPSQGSLDDGRYDDGDLEDGFTVEEALMRRIWESREIYEAGEAAGGGSV